MSAVGCAHGVTVRGEVVQPAQVPVRAFPRIIVTSSEEAEAERLADAVAQHLVVSRSRVRRMSQAEVDAARERGDLGRATAVVSVAVAVSSRLRAQWARRREMTCGPLGCTDTNRPYLRNVPLIVGSASIRVIHGPSGRVLQRENVSDEEAGLDDVGARLRVLERLGERVLALLDQRTELVAVELVPVDLPRVRGALDAIREGRWAEGRRVLERFVEAQSFSTLPSETRARVLYDLGLARRFDRELPHDARFELAADALRAAVRLQPEARYARALEALDEHRQSRAEVVRQRNAMAHNFALLANPEGDVPEPPASYR